MRVLVSFAGGAGHFLPLVPFARAAVERGHDVLVAGQGGMREAVEEAGFAFVDTGGGTLRSHEGRIALRPPDAEHEARVVLEVFGGRVARERERTVGAVCERWRPQLLLRDEADVGAAGAAAARGIRRAVVVCAPAGGLVLPVPPGDELVLAPLPPSFRDPAAPLPTGAVHVGPGAVPAAEPALVYVTLGTIFNRESGDLFERILAGVAALPHEVVVTVGPELDPRDLGAQPDHVRVERFVPQGELLPRCALVVSHGGSGSILGALAHGVPLVLAPMGADQLANASRCAALGVARAIDVVAASPAEVRAAADAVLAGPAFRTAALRLRDEFVALPTAADVLPRLERYAAVP